MPIYIKPVDLSVCVTCLALCGAICFSVYLCLLPSLLTDYHLNYIHFSLLPCGLPHLGQGATVALQQFLALAQTRVVAVNGSAHVVRHLVHQLSVDVGVVTVIRVIVCEANVVPPAEKVLKQTLLAPAPPLSLLYY